MDKMSYRMDPANMRTDPINIPVNPSYIMEFMGLTQKEDDISQIWSNYRSVPQQRNDSKFFGKSKSPMDDHNGQEYQLSLSPPESTSSNCSFSLYNNGAFGVGSQNTDVTAPSLLAPGLQQLALDHSPRSRTPESDFSDAHYPTMSAFSQNYKVMGDIMDLRPSSPANYHQASQKLLGFQDAHIDNTLGFMARTCHQHNMQEDYLCETCQSAACLKCLKQHQSHHTVEMRDIFQLERERGVNTVNTAKSELLLLGDSFKNALKKIESAEQHVIAVSKATAASVISEVVLAKDALEKKERDLLTTIHSLTAQRLDYLDNRKRTITIMEQALHIASVNLKTVLENGGNALDMITLQRFAQAQIEYVRYLKDHFPDITQYNIKLNGFENKLLEVLQNCGEIQETKSSVVNPESIFANNVPVNNYHPERAVGYGRHNSHVRLGRPILLARHNVVTQCRAGSPVPLPLMVIKYPEGNPLALTRPWGVACDPDGNMVVADRSNNRLLVFEVNGNYVRTIGEAGSGPLQFSRPAGMCFDARKRLIVADKDNHRVQVLTVQGKFLFEFGSRGSFEGQFSYPWDVASNANCQIVVSDTRNRRIQMFSAEGHFIRQFEPSDASRVCENVKFGYKVLDSPRGVCFTPEGKLLVTDFNYHHILSVDPDFRKCRIMKIYFDSKTTLQRPQGIICDDEGNVVLADSKNHRVIVLDPSMKIKWVFGSNGTRDCEMERPSGVALTPNGNIAFVDFGNDRLLVY